VVEKKKRRRDSRKRDLIYLASRRFGKKGGEERKINPRFAEKNGTGEEKGENCASKGDRLSLTV